MGLIFVSMSPASATQRHIIVLETMTLPFVQSTTNWFRREMADLGYVEDDSVTYSVINAEGRFDTAKQLLSRAIERKKPSMVVSMATLASRATRQLLEESDTPHVFGIVADPVGEGLVPAIGRSSASNLTGKTHVVPVAAKLEIVAQSIASRASNTPFRIELLHSTYPSAAHDAEKLLRHARAHPGIEFVDLVFDYVPGARGKKLMRSAATVLLKDNSERIDGVWLAVGPIQHDMGYVRKILATGKPIIYTDNTKAVQAGAMLYMVSTAEINGRSIAVLADAIFKGTPAGEIPVTRPDTFSVGLNVATATKLGIVIPSHIVELAEGNIVR